MKNKNVLITGINGFVGKFMAETLLAKGATITGAGRSSVCKHFLSGDINYVRCDLREKKEVMQLCQLHNWDYLIHLAGENSIVSPWEDLLQRNVLGTLHLFEGIYESGAMLEGIIVLGTAYEYDTDQVKESICEQHPIRPNSNYGWSKHLQGKTAEWLGKKYNFPVIIARAFNLVDPFLNRGVCSQLIQEVVDIKKGRPSSVISIGNGDVYRDYLDVRDAAEALCSLLLIASKDQVETYNICSGTAWSVEQLLQVIREISAVEFCTRVDPDRVRVNESPFIMGNNHKLVSAIAWSPKYSIQDSLLELFEFALTTK